MDNATVYCQFELDRFPAAEFYRDAAGRRVHRTQPRHTVEGHLLIEHAVPVPPAVAPPPEADTGTRG